MKRYAKWILSACLLQPLVVGAGESKNTFFDFEHGGKNIRVWTYVPSTSRKDAPIVFVMHGIKRNGEDYLKPWKAVADRHHCVVLVPEFSNEAWPKSRSYNYGNVFGANGRVNAKKEWSYTAIDAIFDHYRKQHGNTVKKYHIFGHSAGSQFVHRMVQLVDGLQVDVAVTANAGSYTAPDFRVAWPYGLKGTSVRPKALKKSLGLRLHVLLGEEDNDPNHMYLSKKAGAMAQGPHRLARGKYFYDEAKKAATTFKVKLKWTLSTVPGVGHSNRRMVPATVKILFGD